MFDCVYFHITRRCQLHCSYCYFDAGTHGKFPELQTREVLTALHTLKRLQTKKIVFTGGEPLLREDLFLLASYARGFAKTVLATNGLAVTPENKYDILECFDDIRISLDGTRRRHDAYRGAGTYDKALQSAILLGEQCAVTITYTKQDEGHIGGLLERLTNTPIRRIYSTCVRKLGRATDRMIPSPERIRMEEDRFFGRETTEHVSSNACGAGHCAGKYMSIHPNGDLYPCHVLCSPAFYMGNILETEPSLILHSPVIRHLQQIAETYNPQKADLCIGERINEHQTWEDYHFENPTY